MRRPPRRSPRSASTHVHSRHPCPRAFLLETVPRRLHCPSHSLNTPDSRHIRHRILHRRTQYRSSKKTPQLDAAGCCFTLCRSSIPYSPFSPLTCIGLRSTGLPRRPIASIPSAIPTVFFLPIRSAFHVSARSISQPPFYAHPPPLARIPKTLRKILVAP